MVVETVVAKIGLKLGLHVTLEIDKFQSHTCGLGISVPGPRVPGARRRARVLF